ncbi:MAG: hypothetical protein ACLTBR_03125 [Anaerostipes sp.]|uniref:hypothetical protein n=1 Tax=Anaerostipes sp. TaxID=1872530 RepID=UPI00399260AE
MEKLTKQEAIKLHRKMWNWIADETERTGKFCDKYEYFDVMKIPRGDCPRALCYCCEYAIQKSGEEYENRCKCCPLYWGSDCDEYMCLDKKFMGDDKGLFGRWRDTNNIEESANLAREIANLEEV